MNLPNSNELIYQLETVLDNCHPINWDYIVKLLNKFENSKEYPLFPCKENFLKCFSRGTTFIAFSFGINGVSKETSKYAHTLQGLFAPYENSSIHFISGSFERQISSITSAEWYRFQVDGING
jgi:hypothetical protein